MTPPYAELARAEQDARELYPNATRVHALWTPASAHEVHVEIWHGRAAQVRGWRATGA